MTSQHSPSTPSTPWSKSKRNSDLLSQDNNINLSPLIPLHNLCQPRQFRVIMCIYRPKFDNFVTLLETLDVSQKPVRMNRYSFSSRGRICNGIYQRKRNECGGSRRWGRSMGLCRRKNLLLGVAGFLMEGMETYVRRTGGYEPYLSRCGT